MQKKTEMTIYNDSLSSEGLKLECDKLIRKIEGKREVYSGKLDGKDVIVKVFLSKLHGFLNYKRELNGFQKLLAAGISTAQILANGKNEHGKFVLVLEKIQNSVDVFSLINNEENEEALKAANEVFRCLAKMHQYGIEQHDLHFGNFLWDGQEIYALDPAEIKFHKNQLLQKQRINQLAILLASHSICNADLRKDFIQSYFQETGENCSDCLMQLIETTVLQKTIKKIPKTLKKTLRSSKRYRKVQADGFTGIFNKEFFTETNLEAFMQNLNSTMEESDILKRGNTCFVSKIKVNGHDAVVKRYNNKGLWHSIRQTFKRGRARKCWLFGHRLSMLDIPSAKPLAFINFRKNGLLWQSYIINEFVAGQELTNVITSNDYSKQQKEDLVCKSKELLKALIQFNITHGDMKTGNVMIKDNAPILIDLDSMKLHRDPITLKFYGNKMLKYFEYRLAKLQEQHN